MAVAGSSTPQSPIERIIDEASAKAGVTLSREARQLLVLPVSEIQSMGRVPEWDEVGASVESIIRSAAEDETDGTRDSDARITAVGIVKAYGRLFCSIPPFCGPRRPR